MLREINQQSRKFFDLDLNDLNTYDIELCEKISDNPNQMLRVVYRAIDLHVNKQKNILNVDEGQVLNKFIDDSDSKNKNLLDEVPCEFLRNYQLRIRPLYKDSFRKIPLRNISSQQIGKIVTTRVLATRVSDVKPLVVVCTYIANRHDGPVMIFQVINGLNFRPKRRVSGLLAARLGLKSGTYIRELPRWSRIDKYQEIRAQELCSQVQPGEIPRMLMIRVRGELTRTIKPGDEIVVTGIYLPGPENKDGIVRKTYIDAFDIQKEKLNSWEKPTSILTLEKKIVNELIQMTKKRKESIYEHLSRSLAPEIYGHEDLKKALLLFMVGGKKRNYYEDTKPRGHLHICIVGDPGVAKSQLLKFISNVAVRGVYTNGKGTSGVGLTASVLQDPETNDWILDGGALVLADMGICCIDEFDKMKESERASIHEAMEQQTISLAKAGITTTLNARTSILAAANPIYGRYDGRCSLADNINLPASLLSRFDLLWLVLDQTDEKSDRILSKHIIHVHIHKKPPTPETTYIRNPEIERFLSKTSPSKTNKLLERFSSNTIRSCVAFVQKFNPFIPEELTEWLALIYTEIRKEESLDHQTYTYTTARSLLSLLRISQALARLSFCNIISSYEVEESLRLMQSSKASMLNNPNTLQNNASEQTMEILNRTRNLIKKLRHEDIEDGSVIRYQLIQNHLNKYYSDKTIRKAFEEYKNLDLSDFHIGENLDVFIHRTGV